MSRALAALMDQFLHGVKLFEKKHLGEGLRRAGMGLEEELLGAALQTALAPWVL